MSPPILRHFRINRLYGYKDIQIDFSGVTRILIAGNGSGKTTIFNALYAILSGRFHRLTTLDFESIECVFTGQDEPVRVWKSQISELPIEAFERAAHLASRIPDIDDEELAAFLQTDYQIGGILEQRSSEPLLRSLYTFMPGDYPAVGLALDQIATSLRSARSDELSMVAAQVKSLMRDAKVLYLPTYRRIEVPLLRNPKKLPSGRLSPQEQIFAETSSDTRHINFGLADVERRLNELSENVERDSNFEYRNISATILDEALADQIEGSTTTTGLPDVESLRRFLSRVSQDPLDFVWHLSRSRPSAEKNERRISAIENLYNTGDILSEGQKFLRYFLTRLGSVIEKTKVTETMLQRFVDACNKYLGESADEKIFTYDPNATRVKVINSWSGRDIPLAHLSSGEKQIVSILAKLYLYDNRKFVLIDEPELSLSIEWQKRILPDMIASGSVSQLFAITHSPFIFDNELDPFAGPLRTSRWTLEGNA